MFQNQSTRYISTQAGRAAFRGEGRFLGDFGIAGRGACRRATTCLGEDQEGTARTSGTPRTQRGPGNSSLQSFGSLLTPLFGGPEPPQDQGKRRSREEPAAR